MTHQNHPLPALGRMIRWPLILTALVLGARLAGELLGWDPRLFAREGWPAFALIGIPWLIPLFGLYHGWVIAGRGRAPDRPGLAIILHAFGALAVIGGVLISVKTLAWPMTPIGAAIGGVIALAFCWRAWPEVLRYSFAYGLGARLMVVAVTIPAVFFEWGTHFDFVPPEIGTVTKLDRLGFLTVAQLVAWVPLTCAAEGVFASFAALARGRRADDAADD